MANKIQTFSYYPPKSDIFIDLDGNLKFDENQTQSEKTNSNQGFRLTHQNFPTKNQTNTARKKRIPVSKISLKIETNTGNYGIPKFNHFGVPDFKKHWNKFCNATSHGTSLLKTRATVFCIPKFNFIKFFGKVAGAFLITLLVAPFFLLWLLGLCLFRIIANKILCIKYGKQYILMDQVQSLYLREQTEEPSKAINCISSLLVLQGNCDLDMIREAISKNLEDDRKFSGNLLKRSISRKLGFSVWSSCSHFDLDEHLRYLPVFGGEDNITEDDAFDIISEMLAIPFATDKPQWELLILPQFQYRKDFRNDEKSPMSSCYAIIAKIHSSYLNGGSCMDFLRKILADGSSTLLVKHKPVTINKKFKASPIQTTEAKIEAKRAQAIEALKVFFTGPYTLLKDLYQLTRESNCFHEGNAPLQLSSSQVEVETNNNYGPKLLSWSRPISLHSLKQMKNVTGSCVTSLLASSIAGSLKLMALDKNLALPEKVLTATYYNRNLLKQSNGNRKAGNVSEPTTVSLFFTAVGDELSKDRLAITESLSKGSLCCSEILKNYWFAWVLGKHPAFVIDKLLRILQPTVVVNNVPGSKEKIRILNGDIILDMMEWNTLPAKSAISLSAVSYDGKIRAGIMTQTAAITTFPDISLVVNQFEMEILSLAKISGVMNDFVFVDD